MLESLAAGLLNRFLGAYVENFDPKQLNIGIWNGDVKLKNLRLKKESLDKFQLPLDVKFGHLGELTLQIPWSNLKAKPCKILIENVYLLASPILAENYDAEEEHRREMALKKEKLEDLEIINKSKPKIGTLTKEEEARNESFTESLITKIVDNLQITIKNIHIRYEDSSVFTENPYSIGLTLKEFSAVSADESWVPAFISVSTLFTKKLLTLKSLTTYWNTNSESIFTENLEELVQIFQELIEKNSQNTEDTQFLLRPVSGNGHLTVNKQGTTEKAPHIKAELFFDEFGIDLDSDQYRDALWTASKFHWYAKTYKFRKFRPKVSVEESPLEWFKYTAKCVLDEIHEKNYKWSWEYFKTRRDQRVSYLKLWKAKIENPTLKAQQQLELDKLEEILSFEDIRFYRSLAKSKYRKEHLTLNSGALSLHSSETASVEPSTSTTTDSSKTTTTASAGTESQKTAGGGGWFSWWGAGKSATTPNSSADGDSSNDDIQMTDQQRQELYNAIEYDEQQALIEAIDIPKDRVKFEVLTVLQKGGLTIKKNKNSNLAEVIFEGCKTQIYQRPGSLLANFQMQECRVEDGTDSTLYKHVVSVKPLHSDVHSANAEVTTDEEEEEPFFHVSFENNPLDGTADSALSAKLRSMTIFHNPKFIEDIAKFFTPPKIHLDTIGMIMNAAESTIEGFTNQTRIGLQYALEEHKTLNCKLDLQAPLIITPLDPSSWSSPVLILDAGHISVISDLADKTLVEEVKSKISHEYSDDDWSKLNNLMYDKFNLHLQDAQILIGPNIKTTIEQLHSDIEKPALLLDNFSMKFLVELCIISTASTLPKFKISGDVPIFKAALNDYQYKIFMQLIDKAIPNFNFSDDDDLAESITFKTFGAGNEAKLEELPSGNESEEETEEEDKMAASTTSLKKDLTLSEKQRLFEFNFRVELIHLSLARCTDGETLASEPLVDVIGKNLALDFYKTAKEMNVDLVLSEVNVEDHIDKSASHEFKKLITSNEFNEYENVEKRDHLFKLNYKRTQRIVEFNNKEIEIFDQDVNLNMAAFKIIVTRKSLLTLLNFVLNTFTDPNAPETPADELRHNSEEEEETAPQKMNVNLNLESIILVLNDDGIKLATLQLSKADINLFMVPEKMKLLAKIGALTLHDEVNEGSPRDSLQRKLVSIDGNDLAELAYETFDNTTNKNSFNSSVKLHTGSVRVNFSEEPFHKILAFLSQFQRMKYIYDKARDAAWNQANNIEDANKIHFDILVRTPIIVFPKLIDPGKNIYDNLTAHLGEIYATNEYVPNGESFSNIISAGLRSTKVSSIIHFENNLQQSSEIICGLGISFQIDYSDSSSIDRPMMKITGDVEGSEIKLTEIQCQYLLQISQSISKAFGPDDNSEVKSLSDLEDEAANVNIVVGKKDQDAKAVVPVDVGTEAVDKIAQPENTLPPDHKKIDFFFKIPELSLTIYNDTKNIEDITGNTLSRCSFNDIGLELAVREDGNFKSDLHIKSFVVEDVRKSKDNKFTDIIPEVNHDSYQFMASLYSEGPAEKRYSYAVISIDSPKCILALDYLFALKQFADIGFSTQSTGFTPAKEILPDENKNNENTQTDQSRKAPESSAEAPETQDESSKSFGFSVNIVNSSVILLADPSSTDSEAIVFKVEQVLVTSQSIMSLSTSNVGMFMCRMNEFDENRLRIIDDFSASLTIDSRGSTDTNFLTNIEVSVEPLLMRLSLRDIRLAVNIFNRASELYAQVSGSSKSKIQQENEEAAYTSFTKEFRRKLSQYAPTVVSKLSNTSDVSKSSLKEPLVIIKDEKLLAELSGLRLVLIGDVHELPVLDMNVKPFNITAKNWSTDLEADTNIESYVNIFDYSTSSWEPLIELWPVAFHISKTTPPSPSLVVDIVSRQLAEISVSTRSIALLSQISSLITDDSELKRRGEDSPYRLLNQTGYDINVWIDDNSDSRTNLTLVKKDEEIPWFFEDWREVRETLKVDNARGLLGVELVGSPYAKVNNISMRGEGEEIFMLQPAQNGVHNRLTCEISLREDKIKKVVLKSTITIENDTLVTINVGFDLGDGDISKNSFRINPGESHALPIDYVYNAKVALQPEISSPGFGWSVNKLYWKNLLYSAESLKCESTNSSDKTNFYFQVQAQYDEEEALAKVYPHMKIVVSAPLEIENLLPFDMSYRIYDKSYKKDWKNFLKKGGNSPIHVVKLEHFILLSVHPLDSGFEKSEFAIINSPAGSEFKPESRVCLKHQNGQKLFLNIHYSSTRNHGAGIKITIYSPYLVLNRTARSIFLSEKFNVMKSYRDGSRESLDIDKDVKVSLPNMFSFDRDADRNNRAILKVDDSAPSRPLSLDAIGQSFDITVPVNNGQTEINLGVSIAEGEGKYKLTKVITISPRFVLHNCLQKTIRFTEIGSSKETSIEPGKTVPLYNMRCNKEKQLMVSFLGSNSGWSSPFNINDIGQIYVKVLKEGVEHVLLKADILMEKATLFINIEDANNRWPFSIRNFSDEEFIFYQSDPNVDENDVPIDPQAPPFKPIYYRLPPKSVMPYAWDYPAGNIKELVIRSHSRERHIQLAEIGNLRPMRLPQTSKYEASIVDLNVVADGPTQSLVISNYDPSTSMYKLKSRASESSTSISQLDKFETIEKDENYYSKIIVRLEGVGISLINRKLQELCYITFRGIELRYNESDLYQNLSVKAKWIQIDNQLYGGTYPIALYPAVLPQSSKEMNNHPTFSGSISKVKDTSHGVLYIKYATILLQELTVEMDEDFIYALLDFSKVPGASWNKEIHDKLWDENLEIPEPQNLSEDNDIYFEALHVQPAQINLSFVRTERFDAEDRTDSQNTLMFFLNILTMAIGNINDAPVRLNALFIENVRVPLPVLTQSFGTHYGQAFLYQIHKILGSADVLGNPVGLFNNISSGLMDIFYEPYQGFIMNDRPQELGIGLAKGGASFLKKSVFGFSDSFAKFTGSMAKGLTAATLDKNFQERRRLNQRPNKPNHALYGFANGASLFVDSVSSGITGIATAPVQGSREGTAGFFKGLGKGLIGLPTKTAIGVFDLASNVSEGIRNTTTVFDGQGLERVRLPRYIDYDSVIRPFSERESQGQFWLKNVDNGEYYKEKYLAHIVLPGEENVILVSFKCIILMSIVTMTSKWCIKYNQIKSVSLEKTGIKIGVKNNTGFADGPFIPISDPESKKFLYKKIGIAVAEYNKHCQVII
ncbi:hypothetical protein PACTADRAFT_18111 [Pachysolen tannophilus NRRL Y-2460]|uniref:Vacuolar protein sorting-associated protein n=1 Tax=Pachysolen tannophilus NRRL Y-2460 TaxID=669874 RepID=A0A1E4TRM8_PACTA|nr:hypothetical protein PACTADRAFT_18111 [Pachysolen tannophilus NRRL Y-2460]